MIKTLFLVFVLSMLAGVVLAQNNYTEITLPELMKKKKEGKEVVIVDVRTDGEYYDTSSNYKQGNIGRIKDALHIPLQELQQNPEAVKKLDEYKDKEVYLICSHSYRSRVASNILLRNGFTHVNNVQGGMTEWFRRAPELEPYKKDYYVTGDIYKNTSPAELSTQLEFNNDPLLIGINNKPVFFYDSLTIQFYKYLPAFKHAIYFDYADSLKLLEIVKQKQRPVVLFNMVNYGAAELTEWLTTKGISNAAFLVGNFNLFYEYLLNQQKTDKLKPYFISKSKIQFTTPGLYCKELIGHPDIQLVDLRHDSLYNKINTGAKHNYKHLKGSVNFFADKGVDAFIAAFPNKKKQYVLISQNGITGIELAGALTEKGYNVYWIMGGLQRWEWYMNNVETFPCNDRLVY